MNTNSYIPSNVPATTFVPTSMFAPLVQVPPPRMDPHNMIKMNISNQKRKLQSQISLFLRILMKFLHANDHAAFHRIKKVILQCRKERNIARKATSTFTNTTGTTTTATTPIDDSSTSTQIFMSKIQKCIGTYYWNMTWQLMDLILAQKAQERQRERQQEQAIYANFVLQRTKANRISNGLLLSKIRKQRRTMVSPSVKQPTATQRTTTTAISTNTKKRVSWADTHSVTLI